VWLDRHQDPDSTGRGAGSRSTRPPLGPWRSETSGAAVSGARRRHRPRPGNEPSAVTRTPPTPHTAGLSQPGRDPPRSPTRSPHGASTPADANPHVLPMSGLIPCRCPEPSQTAAVVARLGGSTERCGPDGRTASSGSSATSGSTAARPCCSKWPVGPRASRRSSRRQQGAARAPVLGPRVHDVPSRCVANKHCLGVPRHQRHVESHCQGPTGVEVVRRVPGGDRRVS
jgi:hypothetical protein